MGEQMKHFVTIKIAPMHPTVFREIAVLIAFQSNDNHRLGGDQSTRCMGEQINRFAIL